MDATQIETLENELRKNTEILDSTFEQYNLKICYKIIVNGRGVDFDPEVVDAFLEDKSKLEEIYRNY